MALRAVFDEGLNLLLCDTIVVVPDRVGCLYPPPMPSYCLSGTQGVLMRPGPMKLCFDGIHRGLGHEETESRGDSRLGTDLDMEYLAMRPSSLLSVIHNHKMGRSFVVCPCSMFVADPLESASPRQAQPSADILPRPPSEWCAPRICASSACSPPLEDNRMMIIWRVCACQPADSRISQCCRLGKGCRQKKEHLPKHQCTPTCIMSCSPLGRMDDQTQRTN